MTVLAYSQDAVLSAWQVVAVLAVVAAAAVAGCWRTVTVVTVKKAFVGVAIAILVSYVVLAAVCLPMLHQMSQEDHVIEWLSASCLLIAWVLGAIVSVREYRVSRPTPMMIFLTAGCFWAFWRELEYGGSLTGGQFWYSRNLFRPEAFLEPAYFEEFRRAMDLPFTPSFLYGVHLACSAAMLLLAATVLVAVLRHWRIFVGEARALSHCTYGRFFLLGAGAYVFVQVSGNVLGRALRSDALMSWAQSVSLTRRVFDEPVEFFGALCIMTSMVAAWHCLPDRSRPECPARSNYPA